MSEPIATYPLTWPPGWRRIPGQRRQRARFHNANKDLTIAVAVSRLCSELKQFGVRDIDTIISTNLKVRLDGLPYSSQRTPDDPAVAVYWKRRNDTTHKVMAVDLYDRIADNIAAVAATLSAMRSIERHGGAQILERAFTGFTALPSPNDWRHVLGFEDTPTWDECIARYKKLARQRHPDCGGSEAAMKELNTAYADAQREIGNMDDINA